MPNLKTSLCLKLIFLISSIAILSAYFIEYILGYQPCNLCLIERIPYALSLIILLMNYKFKKQQKFFVLMLLLIFICSLIISIYHFGIEQGLFQESIICSVKSGTSILSKDELLLELQQHPISCKDVTFRVFGLSLTTINIIVNLILIVLLTRIFIFYEKIR